VQDALRRNARRDELVGEERSNSGAGTSSSTRTAPERGDPSAALICRLQEHLPASGLVESEKMNSCLQGLYRRGFVAPADGGDDADFFPLLAEESHQLSVRRDPIRLAYGVLQHAPSVKGRRGLDPKEPSAYVLRQSGSKSRVLVVVGLLDYHPQLWRRHLQNASIRDTASHKFRNMDEARQMFVEEMQANVGTRRLGMFWPARTWLGASIDPWDAVVQWERSCRLLQECTMPEALHREWGTRLLPPLEPLLSEDQRTAAVKATVAIRVSCDGDVPSQHCQHTPRTPRTNASMSSGGERGTWL